MEKIGNSYFVSVVVSLVKGLSGRFDGTMLLLSGLHVNMVTPTEAEEPPVLVAMSVNSSW